MFENVKAWMVVPRLFAVAALLYTLFFLYMYYRMERKRPFSLEWIEQRKKLPMAFQRAGRLTGKDILPLLSVTIVYAAAAFFNLGNTNSPQSFHQFERGGDLTVTIELRQPAVVEEIRYFTGLYNGSGKKAYRLEFSQDGALWRNGTVSEWDNELRRYADVPLEALSQDYSETFRWKIVKFVPGAMEPARYLRITALYAPLELGEFAIFVQDHVKRGLRALDASELIYDQTAAGLFDEQHIVPGRYDILNSSHFDEIYHARTAYEHLQGVYPMEKTHPPLGKLITSSGIRLFGMTPFGWRFMPALFGVLMVPLLYILLKWMFGKTGVAVCGTVLFAFEFMHFVQTRISTIDVYCVFFILCMYLFMYRYITTGFDTPFWRSSLPLILSGLSFGLGVAAKWQCAYAGAGLLALFLIYHKRRAAYTRAQERGYMPFFMGTATVSLFAFILLPGIVYILCYIPYAKTSGGGSLAEADGLLRTVWNEFIQNQKYMYTYHSKVVLGATHSYSARWYEWLADWRPILYYWNTIGEEGTRGSLWAFTNPLVTWAGLGAVIACGIGAAARRCHAALFILIAYLSQLLPWIPISRITFPYHYFPSMLFICVALAYLFDRMTERDPVRGKRRMITFTAAATALFALFYPVLSGMQTPEWYPLYLLRWMPYNWLM